MPTSKTKSNQTENTQDADKVVSITTLADAMRAEADSDEERLAFEKIARRQREIELTKAGR